MHLVFSTWLTALGNTPWCEHTGDGGWAWMLCWVMRRERGGNGGGLERPPRREEKWGKERRKQKDRIKGWKRWKDLERRMRGVVLISAVSLLSSRRISLTWADVQFSTDLPLAASPPPLFSFPSPLPHLSSHLLFFLSVAFSLTKILISFLLIFFWPPPPPFLIFNFFPMLISSTLPLSGLLSLFLFYRFYLLFFMLLLLPSFFLFSCFSFSISSFFSSVFFLSKWYQDEVKHRSNCICCMRTLYSQVSVHYKVFNRSFKAMFPSSWQKNGKTRSSVDAVYIQEVLF